MITNHYTWAIVLLSIAGTFAAIENYMDYGNDGANGLESGNNNKPVNFRELYKLLVQRNPNEINWNDLMYMQQEHLQPRAGVEQRSPSLRLRFGRSYSKYPVRRSPSLRLRFGRSYYPPSSPVGQSDDSTSAAASAAALEAN
ncbi:hypothetical protein TKK_0018988 [Trichogramma kaykai]|uniref:Short neuropeptide F n=1 Tax=Trichogramma kaykai TaxID=54128 RepID=A0ABD2VWG5_9HYME